MKKHTAQSPFPWRQLVIPLVALICLYVLVPQFGDFRQSFELVRHAEPWALIASVACIAFTYLAAASTYYCIALHRLRYWHTVLVQIASMFVNRLLPAGIGALGSNFAYLRRQKHTPAQAGAVVAMNNGLGFSGHALLLAGTLAVYRDRLPPVRYTHGDTRLAWIIFLVGALVITAAFLVPMWRRQIRRALNNFAAQFLRFRERPWALLAGQLSSVGLTLSNVLSLYCCVLAVHGGVSFITVLLVFTLGVGLGTATPTPGGLGGFEAGLVAGFIAYGIPAPEALAAALLYRLISYWLAIVIGAAAFVYAQHRHVFSGR